MVYKKFKKQNRKFGFTLIEILIVLSIFIFVSTFGLIVNLDSIRNENFFSEQKLFLSLLKSVRSKSLNNELSKNQGIYVSDDNFILFVGDEFDFDNDSESNEFVQRNSAVKIFSEEFENGIIFERFSGRPKMPGEFVVSSLGREVIIKIEPEGRIISQ